MNPNQLLLTQAFIAIVVLVWMIARWQVNAFLALLLVSVGLGAVTGMDPTKIATSIQEGMGGVLGSIAGVIGLGAVIGQLLTFSGGAHVVAERINSWFGAHRVIWSITLVAFLIGLPVFFAVGLALLAPVVLSISKESRRPIMWIGIPALAALSAAHGLVPPHPGPMAAIDIVGADSGKTLVLALIIAVPSIIIAGPLYSNWLYKNKSTSANKLQDLNSKLTTPASDQRQLENKEIWPAPNFWASMSVLAAPALLMLIAAFCKWFWPDAGAWRGWVDLIGSPLVAMLLSTFYACYIFGISQGVSAKAVYSSIESGLGPVAGVLLVVGAGAGFNRTLIESGVGDAITQVTQNWSMSPILLGWLVAALIRVATGSATVAITTSAGIMAPIALATTGVQLELLALSMGAGSLVLSHVNDAGFWLVKEYFQLSVKETFYTWTALETLLSVTALGVILILDIVI